MLVNLLFQNQSRSGPPYTERSRSEAYLRGMISSSNNGSSDFVIVLRSPDPASVIGKVGIWNTESDEIGFMLSREYWGKGYMAEAFSAILEHLWSGKGGEVRRLVADVDPRNDASLRILKRFGFRQTGFEKSTIETHLGWCDSVYLALENPNSKGETRAEEGADDVVVNGCINPNPRG